jgi:hypothetical protein
MKKVLYPLILASLLGFSERANAGWWWNNWWGMDGYRYWQYTTTTVTVPTGYWYGSYGWSYGGFNWTPYYGWYNPVTAPWVSPYASQYNLGYWNAPGWFYGFTDYYTYTYWSLTPRYAYHWSYYCDPPTGYGAVLDVLSSGNGTTAIPFDLSIASDVTLGDHYWAINGGNPIVAGDVATGTFSPNQWVTASPSAITAWLVSEGIASPEDIAKVLDQQVIKDLIAANDNGQGTGVIGLSCSGCFLIPEPSSISLLLLAGAAFVLRRKLTRRSSN